MFRLIRSHILALRASRRRLELVVLGDRDRKDNLGAVERALNTRHISNLEMEWLDARSERRELGQRLGAVGAAREGADVVALLDERLDDGET